MENPNKYSVRKAQIADTEIISHTLNDAFSDDPVFNWFMRDDAKRSHHQSRFFQKLIQLLGFEEGEISIIEEGKGVAFWIPFPGEMTPPLAKEIVALPYLIGATGFARFHRLVKLRSEMEKYKEKSPHAYLWFLGVRSDCQGKGMGGNLLDVCLKTIDEKGIVAALETATPRNLPLYQSRGFEIIHEYRPAKSAPSIWTMRRKPKQN
ncbi:MAG: acetyltransferase [Hyphomonadaceae bacterium]|nr:MAG: acetyltransferase [Hyphomonadaceae bacterium]KAF0186148.1 MAG: acetyltransferase [Hyphomonadaceae bacterium]